MKKEITLFTIALAIGATTHAQLNIGSSSAPDSNAMLEVSGSTKGLLLPRVALTARNNASPMSALVAGMHVYNTATAGSGATAVTPGEYYCDGTQWVRLTSSTTGNDKNIYDGDGTLVANRMVTMDDKHLTFSSTTGNLLFSPSSTGSMGIGTVSPLERLDVNGNVRARNSLSPYSVLKAETTDGVSMALEATASTSAYGAKGTIGTLSNHDLLLLCNSSPVVFMNASSFNPNGTNNTTLGNDLNRWNTVFAGGGGFNAKNVSAQYVTGMTECQGGVVGFFGSSSPNSAFGPLAIMGSYSNHDVAFMQNNTPVMFMNNQGFYPNGNNNKSIGFVGYAYSTVVSYNFQNPSDIRFKKDIENLNYGINDIMKIRSVSYNLKDNKNEKRMLGFIAQEMEKVIPEIVSTNQDSIGYKSIDYVKLIPVLTRGIQEQQALITAQNVEIAELKKKVAAQNQQIASLEKHTINEGAVAELAAQVRELRQMIGLKPITTGNKVAKR